MPSGGPARRRLRLPTSLGGIDQPTHHATVGQAAGSQAASQPDLWGRGLHPTLLGMELLGDRGWAGQPATPRNPGPGGRDRRSTKSRSVREMASLAETRTPGAKTTAAVAPGIKIRVCPAWMGCAEIAIAHRNRAIAKPSTISSPHDGHGAANAVDRMHRRTRSRRHNVLGAARRALRPSPMNYKDSNTAEVTFKTLHGARGRLAGVSTRQVPPRSSCPLAQRLGAGSAQPFRVRRNHMARSYERNTTTPPPRRGRGRCGVVNQWWNSRAPKSPPNGSCCWAASWAAPPGVALTWALPGL